MSDSIVLTSYSTDWPVMALEEIEALKKVIPTEVIKEIAHIGSTSVVGCTAKPIIDIAVRVQDIVEGRKAIKGLESQGYLFWGDNPDETHLFFVKGLPPKGKGRTHHVHFFEKDRFDKHLGFKNILNKNSKILKEYQDLKIDLAKKYKNDRELYTQIKGDYIQKILKEYGL